MGIKDGLRCFPDIVVQDLSAEELERLVMIVAWRGCAECVEDLESFCFLHEGESRDLLMQLLRVLCLHHKAREVADSEDGTVALGTARLVGGRKDCRMLLSL